MTVRLSAVRATLTLKKMKLCASGNQREPPLELYIFGPLPSGMPFFLSQTFTALAILFHKSRVSSRSNRIDLGRRAATAFGTYE